MRPSSLHDDVIEVLDDGTEREYTGESMLVARGGPGSGHHGHSGRPGEVGGSLPSGERGAVQFSETPTPAVETYLRRVATSRPQFSIRVIGDEPQSIDVGTFADAVRAWDDDGRRGHIEVVDPERALWASFGFQESLDVDAVDWNAEFQMFVDVHDYMLQALNDPEFAKLTTEIDRHGSHMVETAERALARWNEARARGEEIGRLDGPAGYNIVFTNDREYVGAGSNNIGQLGGRVFWQPLSIAEEDAALGEASFNFGLSPAYVQFHEMHHGFGSASELDRFSDTISLDFYIRRYEDLPGYMQTAVVDKAFQTYYWGAGRLSGEWREGRLDSRKATAWLYGRYPEFYSQAIEERRAYVADDSGDVPYSYWLDDPDTSSSRLRRWLGEYRVRP